MKYSAGGNKIRNEIGREHSVIITILTSGARKEFAKDINLLIQRDDVIIIIIWNVIAVIAKETVQYTAIYSVVMATMISKSRMNPRELL